MMVYCGLLSRDYRPPYRLIDLVREMSKSLDIECLFFSRGDCEDTLREAEEKTNGIIKRMGYVSQDVLEEYLVKADFLLDIGNHLSGDDYSLPSKVVEYISSGKPIIHMNGVNDSAIEYLEKYGHSVNVPDGDIKDEVVEAVVKFVLETKGKRKDFSEIIELFPQNTPQYTAEIILDAINKNPSKII